MYINLTPKSEHPREDQIKHYKEWFKKLDSARLFQTTFNINIEQNTIAQDGTTTTWEAIIVDENIDED